MNEPPSSINPSQRRGPSSKEELDKVLADCVFGEKDACTLFFNRLVEQCLGKVQSQVRKEVSDLTEADLEIYTQEALGDVTLRASKGKLVVEKSYTLYLTETVLNKIRADKRRKKGHELSFSAVGEERRSARPATTVIFINTLIAPGKPPDASAIERELLRRIGEQVGGLSVGLRDVIARVREGHSYGVIALQLGSAHATVKAQFWQAIETLKQAVGNSGILNPAVLPPALRALKTVPRSLEDVTDLIHVLPHNVAAAVGNLHLEGAHLDEVAEMLGEPRATAEALALYGYWLLRVATGRDFPKGFLAQLPANSHYEQHEVRFTYW